MYCNDNPVMYVDPSGYEGRKWWEFWKWDLDEILNGVGDFFQKVFGTLYTNTVNVINKVHDYFLFGYEFGTSLVQNIGNDGKPITFYFKSASEWYKFWEYEIGIKLNIGGYSISLGSRLGEYRYSIEYGDVSMNFRIGLDKIGFGTSVTTNGISTYNEYFVRPIPIIMMVLALKIAPHISLEILRRYLLA